MVFIGLRVGMQISIEDEVDPQVGLTSSRINNALPFIRVPRAMALGIIGTVTSKRSSMLLMPVYN